MKKIICLIISFMTLTISVAANSAMTWWEGSDATGSIIQDEGCPLIITNELLTFDIPEFPESYYSHVDEFFSYHASVTAEYTLYNPSEYEIEARLLFPFGTIPNYGFILDYSDNISLILRDTEKYEITVNNEPVNTQIRHTKVNVGEFDLEKELSKLKDDYAEHEFYSLDLPITQVIYKISNVDTETYDAAFTTFSIPQSLTSTKVYMPQAHGFRSDDEIVRLGTWVENDMEVSVYMFGDPLEKLEWKFYENGGMEAEITGTAELIETRNLVFEDLAFEYYNEESPVLKHDWYNAILDTLDQYSYNDVVIGMETDFNINDELMRWYDYTLTVPAETTIINRVSAPVYPSIDTKYEPPVYEYTYLLSPAKSWKEFNNLNIQINTEYHLISSSLDSFEKSGSTYALSLEKLPNKELTFKLSSQAKPKKSINWSYTLITFMFTLIMILGPVVFLGLILYFCIKYRKAK